MILCYPWMFSLCNTFTIIFYTTLLLSVLGRWDDDYFIIFLTKNIKTIFRELWRQSMKEGKKYNFLERKEVTHHEDFIFHSIQALTQLSSLLLLIAKTDIFIFLHFVIFIPFMGKIKSDYWVIKPTISFIELSDIFIFNHTLGKILLTLHFWNATIFFSVKNRIFHIDK